MSARRKHLLIEEEEEKEEEDQEKIQKKGKRKDVVTAEDDDEEDGLDEFENDGFIVDDVEDEEDDEKEKEKNPKQTQKKKKRSRSLKDIALDDDDLELIRENKSIIIEKLRDGKFKRLKKAGVDSELMEQSSDVGGLLFDDIVEEEEYNDADDDMADFIVDERVVVCGKGDSLRQRKFMGTKHSSSYSKEAKNSSGKAGLLEEHIREVQIQSPESNDPNNHESFIPTNMYLAGGGNSLDDTDIPERIQIMEDIVGSAPVDRMSIEEESSWILSQLASNINPTFNEAKSCPQVDTVKREDIVRFLELHHTEKYDIPFIAMYRKEQCISLLEDPKYEESENTLLNDVETKPKLKWHKMLWIIKKLDTKWLLLQKRKSMLLRYYNKHFEEECQMSFLVEESSFHKQVFHSITNMLKKAETEREIDDIDMKFNLHFPPAEESFDSGYKRPVMKSYYSNCSKAGLWLLASKFGNPEKFGSSVTLEKVGMDKEEDPEVSPEEIASIYKCETFQTSEDVLKGARHMAAVMLSSEIPFRKYVRSIFMDKALVSTCPTLEGDMSIDSFHEFASVKWLQNKPLSKFEDSQWLFIEKAEEEKLLQATIKLPDHAINELAMTCNNAYLKKSERTSVRIWNEQRTSILQDAISNFLLPSMEKEARLSLKAKAKNWLLMKYGMQLWNRVSVSPYPNNDSATEQEGGVVACCWGNGKPGTTFVMLDCRGEIVDLIHAGSLTLRSQNINDQQRRKNDQQRVLKFLTIYQPHVIVLGAANASCIRLREDINEIISMMSEDNFQDVSQEMKGLPSVVFGDEGLPCLYEDSEISMSQLPRQDGIVRRAVALGRFLLNPLAMVATLCGVKKEIVSWKLNPQEKFLTSDEKLEIIEWVMTDTTNQVGIDINLAIRRDWLLAPLQFVSGLGPKKAGILRRKLLGGTDVRNRRDFANFGLNTNKVFCNAVGFFQVFCNDPNFVDTIGNILDRTRIHPESYNLAEELARAVHEHYILENPDGNATQVNAIDFIQNNPKLLERFDLNEYADRMEIEKGEYRRVTLFDIKMELLHGFKDPRRPYKEPTQDEEFCMITGQTEDVLVEGKRVQAIVRHVQPQQAFCVLDTGMTGVLFKDDFSDETEDISLTDKLHEGVVLTCKIKLIDKKRCRVNLTCKVNDLKNDCEPSFHDFDPYYCEGNIILPSQLEATDKKELRNKYFTPRSISHPHFQNITADQAKEFLADKAVGEYIFHPSSRGLCYLTLSLKVFCGIFVHKDIVEGRKSHDLLRLGKTLKVGDEIFEDIDKVIEHYVNPVVIHLKAIINFQKFKKGSKAEVDELLKLEKEEYPNRIPYGFGISYDHPGTFILSYIKSTNPHHEFIAIHPKGFKFRKQIFDNVVQLMAYFQSHIYDKVAPATNHITVASFKESMSGGWRSNEADQHKESIGYNDRGNGRGRGRRGRGFSPRSEEGRGWRGSQGDGPGGVSEPDMNRDSYSGKWGNGGSENSGSGGWANANSSGWKDNIGKRWGEGGPVDGSEGGTSNFSYQNSHESWDHAGGSYGDVSNDSGWKQGQGQGRGRGRGRRGSYGDGQGRGRWSGNSNEGGRHEGGSYGDASNDSGWTQGEGQGRGRGRGRRGSRGDGQGRGRWSGNRDASSDGGLSQGQGLERGRGRGSQSDGQGRGRWSGNRDASNDSGWGPKQGQGDGNDNSGWSVSHEKNAAPSGGGSGWAGPGGWGGNRDASSDGGWRQGQGQERGRGRGRRGSQGDGQGRGRWSGNRDASNDSGWGPKQGQGDGNDNSGWRVSHEKNAAPSGGGSGWAGPGGWGGNRDSSNGGGWGPKQGQGDGNDNSGWSVAHEKKATPTGGGSGWAGTGGKSW
ncbi:transcription elongation factor SPT6 homolog [Gastrolobium bilobum]|uniref:transcription elongation factor SPT6 homolog n=1 Tax=Gastrolobium bilobum TaxID=150636 RepID=UPI002AB1C18D|nr:transcription elongation factor SPT6 homolog [Gastrolobium bilobum]